MKSIQRSIIAAGIAGALVTSGAVTSAQASGAPAGGSRNHSSQAETKRLPFSGIDVVRATVFGQGPAASRVSALSPHLVTTIETQEEIIRVISDVEKHNTVFLKRFATLSQSGSVSDVEQAFDELAAVLDTSFARLGYGKAAEQGTITPECITVTLFAAAALVYAAVAVLQVTAVATLNVYKTRTIGSRTDETPLSRDKWLASMTRALAA